MEIILASGSPRRKELLSLMGISSFRVAVSDFDESSVGALPPQQLVETLSRGKAGAVQALPGNENALILAADTVVALDDTVLGKPHSGEEAAAMLRSLSGRTHRVYTGFTVLSPDRAETGSECTLVTFRPLTEDEIAHYVATGEPMDKAGAYGIQGIGGQLIEGITGDFFNVMGLPVCRLAGVLRSFGVNPLAMAAERGAAR